VRRITGLPIDTYFPASKIKWLLDREPRIRQQLANGTALVGTIDAYLIYRLTGGAVFASDHTNACRTLLYDIGQRQWSAELCDLFGVPIASLPGVRESSARFGETLLDGLLPEPTPICGVMGDSQAALFAQRCYAPGSAKATFGTGSSVLLNIGADMTLSDSGIVTTIGWVYDGQPTYALEGIINFTGGTVAWMQNQMRYIDDPAETEALAASVPDTGGAYVIPAFVGLSAPYWQPTARGAILGLTPQTTKAHIVRAALEGIAYRIRDVIGLMQADAGVQLATLHADGGMVSNRFLMQYVADLCQVTVRAAQVPELSALGATLSGLLGTGVYRSLDALAALPAPFTDHVPVMPAEDAEARYQGWQDAVKRVL
jgi:glycerol kinase